MTKKYVGVFNATPVYDELAIYFGELDLMPSARHRAAIAYLIDKECCVTFAKEFSDWYQPRIHELQFHNLDRARLMFRECFDYFLFATMNFENIHLQFIGHTVFVSNFAFDLKKLNTR